MIATSLLLLGTATANYVGTFSLVPEDQCAGACICVGDQDVTDPNQEKKGKSQKNWTIDRNVDFTLRIEYGIFRTQITSNHSTLCH